MKQIENRFSIIIPVYNGEKVIERSIKSVIDLDYNNWELIIINDGSSDTTKSVCERYLVDSRIRFIDKANEGVSKTRNCGIQEACGDYILFVDADDYLDSSACRVFNEKMKNADFCIAGYIRCWSEKQERVVFNEGQGFVYDIDKLKKVFSNLYKDGFINSPWAKCYKKHLIKDYFDTTISLGEDLLFNLHYLRNCQNISIIADTVYFYDIQESGSLSSSLTKDGFETLSKVYTETNNFLKDLCCVDAKTQSAVDEKYAVDFINMLERNVRFNANFNKSKCVAQAFTQYKLTQIFQKITLERYGFKWEYERKLLSKHRYGTFVFFTNFLYKVKQLTTVIKR